MNSARGPCPRACSTLSLISSCWLLQNQSAALAFVVPGHTARSTAGRGVSIFRAQHHMHSVRPHNGLFLSSEPLEDAETPETANALLAGLSVASPVVDSPNGPATADSASSIAPEFSNSESLEPGCGDVVEYPLSDLAKEEANDGRERGVAVIVSVNKYRNDAWKLPEDILDKAELQVLCPDFDGGEGSWMVDELESCAFANLGEMKVLKSQFNGAMDKWKRWAIDEDLSEDCGSRDAEWEYDVV